jgi:hypothetical protein
MGAGTIRDSLAAKKAGKACRRDYPASSHQYYDSRCYLTAWALPGCCSHQVLEGLMPRGRPRKTQGNVLMKSAEMIGWAIGGIEREIVATRERLAALSEQANTLRSKLPGKSAARGAAAVQGTETGQAPKRKRRKMSAAGRKRISEMMKKRWAERRKGSK